MSFTDKLWNSLILMRKQVSISRGASVNGRIFIHGIKGGVQIGDKTVINSAAIYNPTSGFQHTYLGPAE